MVLSSTLLAVLASGVQLYFSYERGRLETEATLDAVERKFASSLTRALWEFNFKQVDVILDGIAASKGVAGIDLQTTTGHSFQRRVEEGAENLIVRTISLDGAEASGTTSHLGDLRVEVTLDHIYERLVDQFWTLLLTNIAKTMLASIAMLILFHVIVSKHLAQIASFMQSVSGAGSEERLALRRTKPALLDDLDLVVEAVNTAQSRVAAAHEKVETLNRQLDASNQDLQHSNHELMQFAQVAAHDLQEPVRKIRAFGDLLREEYGRELDETAQEYIEFMVDAAAQQQTRVRDLLSYAQVGAGDVGENPVDLDGVLAKSLEELSLALEEAGCVVDATRLPTVAGSETQLRQVFVNLIGNAIKYRSTSHTPRIRIRAERRVIGQTGGKGVAAWRIAFADNGIGFDPAKSEEIFQPFKRLHARSKYDGNGIGLAIVQKIVLQHRGVVSAEGRPGEGASFFIDLPIAGHRKGLPNECR